MRFYFFLIIVFYAVAGHAQSRLRNVQAVSGGTAVNISFVISAGQTCDGYSIWHTADSTLFYQQVGGNGGGVCGNPSNDEFVNFPHSSPVKNKVNYYKVRIDFPFEESAVLRVYFSPEGRSQMVFFPNPVSSMEGFVNLRMPGLAEASLQGFLLNRFGTVSRHLDMNVTEGKAVLSVSDLEHGVYILWLSDGWNVFSGKFIVMP